MISDWRLSQIFSKLIQKFLWALILFVLIFYAHKVGPSLFLSMSEVAWVLRGLLATMAFRECVVQAHLLGLCYDYGFAFKYLDWIGMLCLETS